MRLLFIIIFLLNLQVSSGQNINRINVIVSPIVKSKDNSSSSNIGSIAVTNLKFYLTKISLTKSQKTVWQEENSYHLIDISNPKSLDFVLNLSKNIYFDAIHFLFGTDSLINISGVMGGDLDPIKGMYWAWNSGYINFKLEGEKNTIPFEFHLGGYTPPFQTVQKIKLKTNSKNNLIIELDIIKFLKQLDLTTQKKIMSPGKEAQQLAIMLSTLFSIRE